VRSALLLETPKRDERSMIGGGNLARVIGLRASCGTLMASVHCQHISWDPETEARTKKLSLFFSE
jgi:hypothetical protein